MSILPAHRRHFGLFTETLALRYLRRNGMRLITRNYHCCVGEIDLIVGISKNQRCRGYEIECLSNAFTTTY